MPSPNNNNNYKFLYGANILEKNRTQWRTYNTGVGLSYSQGMMQNSSTNDQD